MDIASIQQTAPSPAQLPAAEASPTTASDFETFLKMLTAQMKYQDPLNPVDSTDYATQLATFSSVEQAVLTNDLLKSLTVQMSTSGLAEMAALVGKEARTTAPAFFDGQPIKLFPEASPIADIAEVVVRNEAGDEVQRMAISPVAETADWAGVNADGTPMAAGLYSFEVVSMSNGEVIAQTPIATYNKVVEVRLEGTQTMLVLEGGFSVPSNQVSALRDALT